jgi:ribosomal-protein-alanine N-acetyltransferase
MVRVEPVTAAWAGALIEGDDVFAGRFAVKVEAGWSGFPESISSLQKAARSDARSVWGPHLLFDDDGALVGFGGWKGAPVDGTAELGYAVAPARQGRGIATSAVRQLIDRGRASGVRLVVAHTLAQTSASTSVLSRCGFTKVADIVDPTAGPVWRWELRA